MTRRDKKITSFHHIMVHVQALSGSPGCLQHCLPCHRAWALHLTVYLWGQPRHSLESADTLLAAEWGGRSVRRHGRCGGTGHSRPAALCALCCSRGSCPRPGTPPQKAPSPCTWAALVPVSCPPYMRDQAGRWQYVMTWRLPLCCGSANALLHWSVTHKPCLAYMQVLRYCFEEGAGEAFCGSFTGYIATGWLHMASCSPSPHTHSGGLLSAM